MAFRAAVIAFMATAFAAVLMATSTPARAQTTDDGAVIYIDSCARCHKEDGLGVPNRYPPLAGNPDAADLDWVVEVVTNGLSGKVIMGVEYDKDMPAFGDRLSAEDIQLVSEYTVELSKSGPPPPSGSTTTAPVTEGAEDIGDGLFRGSKLLSNGGVACIACHSAGEYDRLGGPGMAMDLNGIIDDFGTAGFVDAVTDPVVEGMIAVFADHPITEQEANDLAAFLETTTFDESGGSSLDLMLLLGVAGFLLLILITALVIRGPQKTYESKLRSER